MASIRLVKENEIDRLREIERSAARAFQNWPGLEWLAAGDLKSAERHLELVRHHFNWVSVDDHDMPTGFLSAERTGDELHIWEISVSGDCQGRGLGTALLENAISEARACGLSAITLTTFRNVPWNAPFYTRFGFRQLAADDTENRLIGLLEAEAEHGLPIAERCAMRLKL